MPIQVTGEYLDDEVISDIVSYAKSIIPDEYLTVAPNKDYFGIYIIIELYNNVWIELSLNADTGSASDEEAYEISLDSDGYDRYGIDFSLVEDKMYDYNNELFGTADCIDVIHLFIDCCAKVIEYYNKVYALSDELADTVNAL